jgi:hypothetical protein
MARTAGSCTLIQAGQRMENRVFFPQAALDEWIVAGAVELQGGELTVLSAGRQYRLAEAVHVLRDVSGTGDTHELVGLVKARAYLEQLGAELVETSMLIGDSAYDVDPGWLGIPSVTFADFAASDACKAACTRSGVVPPSREEDVLGQLLAGGA